MSSGGADYKKMFYQRIGDTLGICERLPCVSNAGGMAIDSARQDAENKKMQKEGKKRAELRAVHTQASFRMQQAD